MASKTFSKSDTNLVSDRLLRPSGEGGFSKGWGRAERILWEAHCLFVLFSARVGGGLIFYL